MRRSAFRPRSVKQAARPANTTVAPEHSNIPAPDFGGLEEQIANIGQKIAPMRAAMETLVSQAQHDSRTVPSDLHKAVGDVANRLSDLEKSNQKAEQRLLTMEKNFSKALMQMGDQVERVSGGRDSDFNLAYAMDQLLKVLESRSYRVMRDSNGNMAGLETDTGKQMKVDNDG